MLLSDPSMQYPANRQILSRTKANANRTIDEIKTDTSVLGSCEDSIREMVVNTNKTTAPGCLPLPERQ